MINPAAVEAFLARTNLKDSSRAKKLTDEELDERLAELEPPPLFVTPPKRHQKVCFLLGAKYDTYAFWPDPGGGKTWLALNLIRWRITRGDFERACVLVPYGTMLEEWSNREAPKHVPDLRVLAVTGTPMERSFTFWDDWRAQVVVVTYAAFLNYLCDRNTGTGEGMTLNEEKVAAFIVRFGCIVGDEFHFAKSHQTLTFKTLKSVRQEGLRFLYELTGTPFGDEPHDLWSQFYLMDFGETLGATLGLFRAAFFTSKRNFWGGFEHKFKKSMKDILNRIVAHRSIRYASEEFDDLPPITGGIISGGDLLIRRVDIPDTTRAYYDSIIEEIKEARGDHQEMENAWHRMRRLSSGYALPKDDEGEEHPLIFPQNPKLDALLELLSEVPLGRQVLVFCYYQFSGKLVTEALRKAKYKVGRLYGGQGAKEQGKAVSDFLAGNTHILVVSDAAAHGLNLQVANYCFMFETPTSPIKRRQMEKRLHRGDQAFHVWIHDLVARDTVDEKMLKSLKEGSDLFTAVMSGRESV